MLDRAQIVTLLDALAKLLAADGHKGDLFLVGGAAMALAYDTRRATRHLDGVFEPRPLCMPPLVVWPPSMTCPTTGSTTP